MEEMMVPRNKVVPVEIDMEIFGLRPENLLTDQAAVLG